MSCVARMKPVSFRRGGVIGIGSPNLGGIVVLSLSEVTPKW